MATRKQDKARLNAKGFCLRFVAKRGQLVEEGMAPPVSLDPRTYDLWLDPRVQDAKRLESLLVPFRGEGMEAYPVSTLVNNPKTDNPKCIEPVARSKRRPANPGLPPLHWARPARATR